MTANRHEATTIGQALAIAKTASAPRFVKPETASMVLAPPATPDEARQLREWAEAQPSRWAPIEPAALVRHLDFMAATLPSRNVDTETGRSRVAVYVRLLGEYSEAAIAHLSREACATLDWFPTPSQCLRILKTFSEPATPRDRAIAMCRDFAQRQFDSFRATLLAGEGTDELLASVPEQWNRIAVEQGLLRWTKDEGFSIAPRHRVAAAQVVEDELEASEVGA